MYTYTSPPRRRHEPVELRRRAGRPRDHSRMFACIETATEHIYIYIYIYIYTCATRTSAPAYVHPAAASDMFAACSIT